MLFKKISVFVFLVAISGCTFSMDIVKGKNYKNINSGNTILIKETCKEAWDIEGLATAGAAISMPALLAYFTICAQKSGKEEQIKKHFNEIYNGNEEAIKACVDPQYFGSFYYGHEETAGTCVHESWLRPLEDDLI